MEVLKIEKPDWKERKSSKENALIYHVYLSAESKQVFNFFFHVQLKNVFLPREKCTITHIQL